MTDEPRRGPWVCTLAVMLILALGCARADGPTAPAGASAGKRSVLHPTGAQKSFERFCDRWMQKLRDRESRNQAQAAAKGEYTGYGSKPLRCETKSTGVPSSPFVGKLAYTERIYRKDGSRRSKLVHELEVLEIFRLDGADWKY